MITAQHQRHQRAVSILEEVVVEARIVITSYSIHYTKLYETDLLTDRAVDFINKERDDPFMLYIGHKAVHPDSRQLNDGSVDPNYPRGYVPAPRHRGLYEEEVFPRRPNVVGSADSYNFV